MLISAGQDIQYVIDSFDTVFRAVRIKARWYLMLFISAYSLTCRGVAIAKTDEWFFSLRGSAKSAIKHEKHEITKRTHLIK